MEKLLELENVSYSYQDGKEKNQILDHASYLFEKGKIENNESICKNHIFIN